MVVDYLSISVLRVKAWYAVRFSGRKHIWELSNILFFFSKDKYSPLFKMQQNNIPRQLDTYSSLV